MLNRIPKEVEDIIWNHYWLDTFNSKVVNSLNNYLILDKILLNFINSDNVFNISVDRKNEYLKINKIVKSCYLDKSYKVLTKSTFFKSNNCLIICQNMNDNFKYVLSFLIFYSNFMAMKVYCDFKKKIIS